ncbi:unnamed protein product [Prorocentrum cordatum]|uniref:Uncharacterized protein n=1 Tax=Prorocentrum cordatum TaxID=2364126 RepID=A0ABN9QSN5_9DINO|nr:unnamed protein product [Polarella glacialis]
MWEMTPITFWLKGARDLLALTRVVANGRISYRASACPSFAMLSSVVVVSFLTTSFVVTLIASYQCGSNDELRSVWISNVWWACGLSPNVAVFAWCVHQRHIFSNAMLHLWSWRYGILAGSTAVLGIYSIPLYTCLPETPAGAISGMVRGTMWTFGKVMLYILFMGKVQQLGHAWAVHIMKWCLFGVASSWSIANVYHFMPSHFESNMFGRSMEMTGHVLLVIVNLVGLRAMAASAAFAIRSTSRSQRHAGAYVALTVVALVGSFTSTMVCVVFYFESEPDTPRSDSSAAAFVDAMMDCFGVVMFSGLVGPARLQVLSQTAFAAINAFSDDQLQDFYLQFLDYLDEAQIKWIKCGYLRRLSSAGSIVVRCQNVPLNEVIIGSAGFPILRTHKKSRFVVSYPWLSKHHPDPDGSTLRCLVDQLDAMGAADEDGVFMDYLSMPQHDGADAELQRLEEESSWPAPGTHRAVRSAEEDAIFNKALGSMSMMFSTSSVPVVVLPMEGLSERAYIDRGWCYLEFCLALSFGIICNEEIHVSVKKLCKKAYVQQANTVDGFMQCFESKTFTYNGDAGVVMNLFESTVNRKTRRDCQLAVSDGI